MKPTLLIIIDNLKRGGAESLLVGILPSLNKIYSVIIATLSDECDFEDHKIICSKKYSLGFKSKLSLVSCIIKLKRIIKQTNPSLIHSHLFYSSLVAKISCPENIPLIYSLHSEMSKNVFSENKAFLFLEKYTRRPNHYPLAVSETVLRDYEKSVGTIRKKFVLLNYVSDEFFVAQSLLAKNAGKDKLKLIAVGNIKQPKNYSFLLKAFEELKDYPVSLDIYGGGGDKQFKVLQAQIDKYKLPVYLKGSVNNIFEILPLYDLYVSSSTHEGFGIAAAEAMAAGLPLLLSDIRVFHEISFGNALFFNPEDPASFAQLVIQVLNHNYDLSHFSQRGIEISKKYSSKKYLEELLKIYHSASEVPLQKFIKTDAESPFYFV